MEPNKILYTNGRDVTVTDSSLRVKNNSYRLNGITRHGMLILKPYRIPGIFLMALGLLASMCGYLKFVPPNMFPDTTIDKVAVDSNTIVMYVGLIFFVFGVLLAVLVREKYAVHISTAEGEKNVVISHKREYISQIVDALNAATFKFSH